MISESLDQWSFVVAAYAVGLFAVAALVAQSWFAMHKAERRRERARSDRSADQ